MPRFRVHLSSGEKLDVAAATAAAAAAEAKKRRPDDGVSKVKLVREPAK
jgi:hypothetical protein